MVNVPPLLCSTPPPIDFGEDDDDSGLQSTINLDDDDDDFGLVTSSRSALTKETHTEAQPVYSERPPELELIGKPNAEEIKQNVEAFNYQVKQSPSLDDYQETPPPLEEELQEEEEEEEEEIANINDNVPSLKLDSLSLYSTESVSAASTLSPVAVADEEMPAPTKAPAAAPPVLSHQVTLEDVSDDSDEECSPKKPKELFIREGAEDFFAIEVLATPTETAFSFPSDASMDKPAVEPVSVQFAASFEQATAQSVEQQQQEEHQQCPAATEEDEFDDFGDFADFSAVPEPEPAVEVMPAPVSLTVAPPTPAAKDSPAPAADDGFDDFQEFATPPAENADDDDDDFGDFSEPLTAAMATVAAVPPPPQPAAAPLSIDERIKPVLELMFPLSQTSSAATEAKRRPLAQCQSFNFGAIEQAQALDYQWTSSEMRHSLVRALGIDSRNILFGDKWNASMPRFAANLSFDPLKPLKPLEPSSQQLSSVGLEATAAATPQTSQAEARSGASNGESCVPASSSSGSEISSSFKQNHNPSAELNSDCLESTAASSAAAAAAATATLSTALSANGYGHNLNGSEQLHQQQQHQQQPAHQQQFDLRAPTPPPVAAPTPAEDLRPTASTPTGFAMPLKETHIYTPSKSDTAVARTTTLAPIDFDYEIAATGIIIDETVVKKEYRDVEYKPPPFGLDSPSRLASSNGTSSFELPTTTPAVAEDDDFSDFQSMPAKTQAALQPPRNGTPTFGEQMILCPAILLPQAIPLAKTAIEWGDNALSSINAEEMARIEDLFSAQSKPPTISATVAKQPPQQQQQQQQEDDEWSDFVSVPVGQQQQQQPQQQTFSNNNNVNSLKKPPTGPSSAPKDDDWSDFVSSTPLPSRPSAPQFNSGAWQSANFYNNPLSLYQHQKQTHAHSNLVPSSSKSKSNTNTNTNHNNNNNNNNVPATPQQIHIMHDFSTAPSTTAGGAGVGATYQQHHQRQQFQIGNAKVAPRISLIPDLSFVAPALPTNAGAFMGSLPKPSFAGKK